jgi:hypothetical protein
LIFIYEKIKIKIMEKITKEILKEAFPERPKEKYFKKYDFGLLIVIGAPIFIQVLLLCPQWLLSDLGLEW